MEREREREGNKTLSEQCHWTTWFIFCKIGAHELVLLLQDDDIPPLDDEWLLNSIRLFVALPKLAVLSGYGGLIDGKTVKRGQQRWEFADLQTYNDMISWPLPYEVDGVPFMPVSCGYLSPLFLRRTFLDAHYKQFDKNLSDPGEPGIGLDADSHLAFPPRKYSNIRRNLLRRPLKIPICIDTSAR